MNNLKQSNTHDNLTVNDSSASITKTDNKLECLIDKCKSFNLSIQLESYKLREKIINESLKKAPNFTSNLDKNQIEDLLFFVKHKPFMVTENDKNIGYSIMSKENYVKMAYKHLDDTTSYEKLSNNPLDQCISTINNCLFELKRTSDISKKLFDLLVIKSPKNLGKFRILPKIHKSKFSTRPIINCSNTPTEKLCQFIDLIFKPLVEKISHILKDSQ